MRAKLIDFWIEVAHECFNIGNFNSLMAITTALNLSSISRLKKTVSGGRVLRGFLGPRPLDHESRRHTGGFDWFIPLSQGIQGGHSWGIPSLCITTR